VVRQRSSFAGLGQENLRIELRCIFLLHLPELLHLLEPTWRKQSAAQCNTGSNMLGFSRHRTQRPARLTSGRRLTGFGQRKRQSFAAVLQ
jgi:hypothetical protein